MFELSLFTMYELGPQLSIYKTVGSNVSLFVLFHSSSVAGQYHTGILVYAQILHISASSESSNNQFLKIRVTRTAFQICIFKNQ